MRSLARRALLVLGGLALGLAVAEALTRTFAPDLRPLTGERADFWHHDSTLGWFHRPGATGRFVGPSWDVEIRINGSGLRDVEHEPARRPGLRRLLLLGDSFGWGYGVEQDRMLSAVLRERCPGFEVINGSVSGYSTDQEYLFYRERGSRWAPDQVLLLIHENDLLGNGLHRMYGYEKPRFVLEGQSLELRNVPVPERKPWEKAYSRLVVWSYFASGVLRRPAIGVVLEFGQPFGTQILDWDPHVSRRLLLRFARELREAGVEFRWALIPMQAAVADWLRGIGREAGVRVIDLDPALRAAAQRGVELTLRGDLHWSADGHRVAAEALAGELGCSR